MSTALLRRAQAHAWKRLQRVNHNTRHWKCRAKERRGKQLPDQDAAGRGGSGQRQHQGAVTPWWGLPRSELSAAEGSTVARHQNRIRRLSESRLKCAFRQIIAEPFFLAEGSSDAYVYTSELYPTEVRTTGVAISSAWTRACAVTLRLSFGHSLPRDAHCRASSPILFSTVVNSRYSFGRKLLFRLHMNEGLRYLRQSL